MRVTALHPLTTNAFSYRQTMTAAEVSYVNSRSDDIVLK
jgi:hypothetical protein